MKKGISGLFVLSLVCVLASGLFASAADDYKVIKNAVQSPAVSKSGQKSAQWFKILVTDGGHEKVKITLPVSLVEIMINSCPDERIHFDHGCKIDMRRVWSDLKAAGPLALVEVEDRGETVKIWLE